MRSGSLNRLLLLGVLFVASGATCWQTNRFNESVGLPPAVFQGTPSLAEALTAVNATRWVYQLEARDARVSVTGYPALRAKIVLQKPKRFRMQAGMFNFSGPELDIGSNDELFWMWFKQHPEPAVYYATHDQFAQQRVRQMLPVEPLWLIDALGLVYLDPNHRHEGPFVSQPGELEIRTRLASAQGELIRTTVIHDQYAWVLRQQLSDSQGQLLASVQASRHRFYPGYGVSLPHHVKIQIAPGQPNQMQFTIDVGSYQINQITGEASQLWALPSMAGVPQINLVDPNLLGPKQSDSSSAQPVGGSSDRGETPYTGYIPRFRGDTLRR
ncbi:MAG: hypothetical protein VB912_17555 [Pirellulaceae bacterium]